VKGYTALHLAARRRDGETAKVLLEWGANPAAVCKEGQTARDMLPDDNEEVFSSHSLPVCLSVASACVCVCVCVCRLCVCVCVCVCVHVGKGMDGRRGSRRQRQAVRDNDSQRHRQAARDKHRQSETNTVRDKHRQPETNTGKRRRRRRRQQEREIYIEEQEMLPEPREDARGSEHACSMCVRVTALAVCTQAQSTDCAYRKH
jgi:hypothetical protein